MALIVWMVKGNNGLYMKDYSISWKKSYVRKLSGRVSEIENELDNLESSLLAIFSVVLSVRAEHPAPPLN